MTNPIGAGPVQQDDRESQKEQTQLPITDTGVGSVPVYDCHVILTPPDEHGVINARCVTLPSVVANGTTERDTLCSIVDTFKAELRKYHDNDEPIPWATDAKQPAEGEVERWIPVHL